MQRPDPGPAAGIDSAAPEDLVELLAVLRRPRTARDRLPGGELPLVAGVNPDAVRLAREDDGRRWFVVPAEDIRYRPPLPDTPECERFREPAREPQAGVCLVEAGPRGGGATCSTADQIREGFSQLTSDHIPGERRGTAHVAGIVPDGVTRVVLEFPRGPQPRVVAEVRGNVYSATFNGSAASRPRTYWQTADGLREVARQPASTPRGRRAARRSRELDRAATATPSVRPRSGGPRTIFTMRLRGHASAYLVTLRGPGGEGCGETKIERVQVTPGRGGLVRLGFTAASIGSRHWCRGTYSGTVEAAGRQAGTFSFRVR